jgi:hypothetical protein
VSEPTRGPGTSGSAPTHCLLTPGSSSGRYSLLWVASKDQFGERTAVFRAARRPPKGIRFNFPERDLRSKTSSQRDEEMRMIASFINSLLGFPSDERHLATCSKMSFSREFGLRPTSGLGVIQELITRDDARRAKGRLVIFPVHCQTSVINFGSRERGLDLAGLDLTKYSPETCATSGEVGRHLHCHPAAATLFPAQKPCRSVCATRGPAKASAAISGTGEASRPRPVPFRVTPRRRKGEPAIFSHFGLFFRCAPQ